MALVSNFDSERQSRQSFDVDYGSDPASGSFFGSDIKKHDDLKQMLDSNKDNMKLEAMKRIIGMVAKGRDASELFPAVVKNVVSSNLEVKKLVYVYLVRYAEEQQDLALLSISSFQRGLKDPNPLIRACALRVLSSIRVPVIVPIMLLAIKETVTDLSPYVRKTTAHAIPKLYSLDPEQKEELEKVIEKLLSDMSTLVVGSAVMAFEEVCPERIDLIHTNYRKLCCLLIDVEEWGQVIIMNMLTRYARTQFLDPNAGDAAVEEEADRPFYEEETKTEVLPHMDKDHRLLLTITKPLLQSRNSAVVLSVAQLYQHLAPREEVCQVARALVRLLRGHREIQAVVLTNIATLSMQRKGMFEPFLKSFFVRSSDPTQIKLLKLEVMTNVANEANIVLILRELQTYIWSSDSEFVAASIQAIGRCATNIKEVTDSCLNGLLQLLSNKDELVVGESVVVVRKLLQSETVGHKDIITHMAHLFDNIRMPTARASILWLLGEYCEKVPKIAPDVLRKMAKSFVNEEDVVKLQIITLAAKLYLTNPKQTHLLCQYVFNLAKYDTNYDIRDRGRFLRALLLPHSEKCANKFAVRAKRLLMAAKPPPVQVSIFKDRDQYQLSTLSHFINARAMGYSDLPPFPESAPDPSVRTTAKEAETKKVVQVYSGLKRQRKEKAFYSDEDQTGSNVSETESDPESDSSSDENDTDQQSKVRGQNENHEGSSSDSESDSDSSSDTSDSVEVEASRREELSCSPPIKSNLDLLLDLDHDLAIGTPVLTPSLGGFLTPVVSLDSTSSPSETAFKRITPFYIPSATQEILNRISGKGLSVDTRFTRSPHLYSPSMTSIELTFKNNGPQEIKGICIGSKKLPHGMSMHDFALIPSLSTRASVHGTVGIDFQDSINPANFDIVVNGENLSVSITPTVGELVEPVSMTEADFNLCQGKLRGMNEHSGEFSVSPSLANEHLKDKVYQNANLMQVPSTEEGLLKFGGQTTSGKSLVLLTVKVVSSDGNTRVAVHCEKLIVASMLFKQLQGSLSGK